MPTLKQFEKATGIRAKRWKEAFAEVKQVKADEETATEQLVEQAEKIVELQEEVSVLAAADPDEEGVVERSRPKRTPHQPKPPRSPADPSELVSVRTIEDETGCKIELLLGGERESDGKNYLEKKLGITYLDDADGARTQVSQADAVKLRDYGHWRAAEDRMIRTLNRKERSAYTNWQAENDQSRIEDELAFLRVEAAKYTGPRDVEYYDRQIGIYEDRLARVKAGNATPKPERFLTDYDRRFGA